MYALIWHTQVLDALARIYLARPVEERERMAGAVERPNARFKAAPLAEGESRAGDIRITFVGRLSILFHVDSPARVVTVVSVRYVPPHP